MKLSIGSIEGTPEECHILVQLLQVDALQDTLDKMIKENKK